MGGIELSAMTVRRVCAVNRISFKTHANVSRRSREMWGLSVKLGGTTVYSSGGRDILSDSDHIVILPKGASYSFSIKELGECVMIEFELAEEPESASVQSFPVKNKLDFINKIIKMEHIWTFKKPAYELLCMSGLYGFLATLREGELAPYQLSSKYALIEPSVRFLEEHYGETGLTNEMLAGVSGISAVYMRKIFCSIYNMSPMRYLQMIRIEKAKDMLIGDFPSITEISAAVGFESIYHFSKTFKKVTGHTPTEYSHMAR